MSLLFFRNKIAFSRVFTRAYIRYMFDNFFKHIDIDPNNAHILDGNADDLNAECLKYEDMIKEAGGVELFIGRDVLRE